MSEPIGVERGQKLERYLHETIGLPDPLHFAKSFMLWRITSLAELTEAQGKELIKVGAEQLKIARRQMAEEAARRNVR